MEFRSLVALLSCSLLAVACEDAVVKPPSAPVPSQTYFVPQQATLPPGSAYQPGWTGGGAGSTALQPPRPKPGQARSPYLVVGHRAPAGCPERAPVPLVEEVAELVRDHVVHEPDRRLEIRQLSRTIPLG
jgi:hypothetical protein